MVRVSQVQPPQPFLAPLVAVPVLAQGLDPATVLFSLAGIGVVFIGRPMPLARAG